MYIPMGFIYLAVLYMVFQSAFIAVSVGGIALYLSYSLLMFITERNPRLMWNGAVLLTLTIVIIWTVTDYYVTL